MRSASLRPVPSALAPVKNYRFVMNAEDVNALRAAVATLEHPGLAARLGEIAGKPIELVGNTLPESQSDAIDAGEMSLSQQQKWQGAETDWRI
jgi:hypothetical protein